VIAVSKTIKNYIVENYPATPVERIQVIHRGVAAEEYPYGFQPDETWKAEFYGGYPDAVGKQLITLPGRITRLKGHEAFIEIMSNLVNEGRSVHGLIVGGAGDSKQRYLDELKQKVHSLGLDHHISFTGHRQDLKNILAISRLVLSLSTQPESFGRTTLEALRLGIATAGYDHGGVGEILRTIYPAGSLPMNDGNAVLARVRSLLDHPMPVPDKKFFPLSEMQDKTLAVYDKITHQQ
jgi:glycosyltransferase involved in cell wall biosynthesis